MKQYTIKEEYLHLYGPEATTETIINFEELTTLAAEWNKPIEELIDQLNEI